jgi:hypothetical protein
VNVGLSKHDVEGATFIANMIFQYTECGVEVTHDMHIDGDMFGFCAIAFGLGFNGFTDHLAHPCDNRLCSVRSGPSFDGTKFRTTDYFRIGGRDVLAPPENGDDAIVARIVPHWPDGKTKNGTFFVSAGRTTAAYYLAHH